MLDAHDRGIKYIARKLAEAGMEVILTNFGVVGEIVNSTLQEDVDVIGISSATGGHMVIISDLMERLKVKSLSDNLVIAGGTIPTADIPALQEMGVGKVFGPVAHINEVVN